VALGNLYYRQGSFSEAAPHFDAIVAIPIESDPRMYVHHKDALLLRSGGQFQGGDLPGAIQSADQAAQAFSGDPFAHLVLGLLYQLESQDDLAKESLDKAIERDIDFEQGAWSTFENSCLKDDASKQSFATWVLNELPFSNCLGRDLSDPKERVLALYDLLSDALTRYRDEVSFIFTRAQCPYLYTEDPLTGEWEFDTTILYRIVDHEAAQMRKLTQFKGRVLIREEEPEITYLNRLYVLAEMADGSVRILQPDLEALRHTDAKDLVLHRGEEILVTFEQYPVAGEVRQWWVMVVGYYSPLR
jgi:tetratricopeptide (TPR) repeat protein